MRKYSRWHITDKIIGTLCGALQVSPDFFLKKVSPKPASRALGTYLENG